MRYNNIWYLGFDYIPKLCYIYKCDKVYQRVSLTRSVAVPSIINHIDYIFGNTRYDCKCEHRSCRYSDQSLQIFLVGEKGGEKKKKPGAW